MHAQITDLHRLIDVRFDAAGKLVETSITSADKAVTKAEEAASRRFESVNEFRKAITDLIGGFMPRAEVDARFATIGDRMVDLAAGIGRNDVNIHEVTSRMISRAEHAKVEDAIAVLRSSHAATSGRSTAIGHAVTLSVAVLAIVVSVGVALLHESETSAGIRPLYERMDALSARMNALTKTP